MTSAIPAPPAGTAAAYVQRGLVIFAVLWQVAWSATDILPRSMAAAGGGALLISAPTAAAWVFLVATVWGPGAWRRWRPLAIGMDLVALGVAAIALSLIAVDPSGWSIGTIATVRAAVFAAIVLTSRPGLIVAGLLSLISAVVLIVGPSQIGAVAAVLETLYAVALSIGAAALARGLRRLAARIDEAHRRVSDEETVRLVREEVERSTLEHERRIHDQVLNTLAAIGRGALANTADIKSRCRDAAMSLRRLVNDSALTRDDARLALDAALDGLPDRWVVARQFDASVFATLPDEVAGAFGTATAEAVRNIARHSNGRVLSIGAARVGATWTVTVDDDGQGLPPDVVPGIGMTRSIRGSMTDIGGAAEWAASPSGGTRILLTWTRPGADEPSRAEFLEADAVAVLPAIGPPFLLAFLVYAAVVVSAGWQLYPQPGWAALWLAIAVAAAPFAGAVPKVASLVGLNGGPTWSWRVLAGITLTSAAALAVVRLEVLAVADASMPVWVTWSSEVAVGLLFMTVVLGPPWTIAPALVVWVLAQGGSPYELIQPGSIMLVVAAIFAVSMRRRARDYATAVAQLMVERARNEAAAVDERRRRQRFEMLASYTADLLENISSGDLDPHDERVRELCLREERVARSLVRVDRDEGVIESLLHEVVVVGRGRDCYIDADILGLGEMPSHMPDLSEVRSQVLEVVSTRLPAGTTARITGGWEEDQAVVRLLAELDGEESMWEWGRADDAES